MNNHFLLFESYNGNEYKYLGAKTGNAKEIINKAKFILNWKQFKSVAIKTNVYGDNDLSSQGRSGKNLDGGGK